MICGAVGRCLKLRDRDGHTQGPFCHLLLLIDGTLTERSKLIDQLYQGSQLSIILPVSIAREHLLVSRHSA